MNSFDQHFHDEFCNCGIDYPIPNGWSFALDGVSIYHIYEFIHRKINKHFAFENDILQR